MIGIEFPAMRNEVIAALNALADRQHQDQHWGVAEEGVPFYDDLTLNVHVLYDDVQVLPDPGQSIGTVILEPEAPALRALHDAIDPLLSELGDAPDTEYTQDPRWDRVVSAAAAALRTMRSSER